ncbi:hypothetical protein CYY_005105 [Polysphondylium violaceum]|uniref:Uncharacterized protein n=1 Tax=Polysphondylium violaceum TaxID=133409 RepID=A0A8J4UZW1_9MYCE|nr:hypothetical protein CYY_005105 [Polysphondylium violaceum]
MIFNTTFFNNEDWWSTFVGFASFILCSALSFITKANYYTPSAWTKNPLDFFSKGYFWVSIPVAFAVMYIGTKFPQMAQKQGFDIRGFTFVFVLAILSMIIGNQTHIHNGGFGTPFWSICIGVFVSNIVFRGFIVWPKITAMAGRCFNRMRGYAQIPDVEVTSIATDQDQNEIQAIDINNNEKKATGSKDKEKNPNIIPAWLKPVLLDEYFIKVSLVLLAMDLKKSKEIFGPALIVSADTMILFTFIAFVGYKICKIDRDMSIVAAAAVSICGSSAAKAIGSTIRAKEDAKNYPIAVMALWTVAFIPTMPPMYTKWMKEKFAWSSLQAGAWIGGTIDTTGAVVACAALIDDEAKQSAAIVKMLQNCLIVPICLGVLIWSIYFNINPVDPKAPPKRPTLTGVLKIVLERFPKFVLGFFILCIFLTVLPNADWKTHLNNTSLLGSTWFETVGFVCIGLNIDIVNLLGNGAVLKLSVFYLAAQSFDTLTTGLLSNFAFYNQ